MRQVHLHRGIKRIILTITLAIVMLTLAACGAAQVSPDPANSQSPGMQTLPASAGAKAEPAKFEDIELAKLAWYFTEDYPSLAFQLCDNNNDGMHELYASGTNLAISSSFVNGNLRLRFDTHGGAAGDAKLSYDSYLKKVLLFSGYYSTGTGNETVALVNGAAGNQTIVKKEWKYKDDGSGKTDTQTTWNMKEIDGKKGSGRADCILFAEL